MFDTGALTNLGRNLLASSTAGNKIVFTAGITDERYKNSSTIASTTTEDQYMGALTGYIYSCMYSGGACKLTVRFQNNGSGKTCYGVWLKARLESQSGSQAILFAAVMDTDGFYVPSTSTINSYIDVTFQLTFTDAGGNVNIIEEGACSIDDLNNAVVYIQNHSLDLNRTYKNFIEAQAYCKEGCGFSVDPNATKQFVTNIKDLIYDKWSGTAQNYWISDICDQYVAAIILYNSHVYLWVFDMTQCDTDGEVLFFDSPIIDSPMGDEMATNGNATICKVDGKYFVLCYTDAQSTNLWWYNQDAGQDSSNKATGRAACTPINTYTYRGNTFTRGWWYKYNSGTVMAARAIGGRYALITNDITDNTQYIHCTKLYLSLGQYYPLAANSTGTEISTLTGTGTDLQAILDMASMSYPDRTKNWVDYAYAYETKADFIMVGSYFDSSTEYHMIFGECAIGTQNREWQELLYSVSTVNDEFVWNCGADKSMFLSQLNIPIENWSVTHWGEAAMPIQRDYDGFTIGSGHGYDVPGFPNAIKVKVPLDTITTPESAFQPKWPFFINNFNFTKYGVSGSMGCYGAECGSISVNTDDGTPDTDLPLVQYVVRGTQIFTYKTAMNEYGGSIVIAWAPNASCRGMKLNGKI